MPSPMTANISTSTVTISRCARGGEKVTYIVTVLSERYHVSERKVYSLVKRFGQNCKVGAV